MVGILKNLRACLKKWVWVGGGILRGEGTPAKSLRVSRYMEFVKKEQGVAGITSKQAKVILRHKVKTWIEMLRILRDKTKNVVKKMLISHGIAIFSLAFCTSKRGTILLK